jgi:hypothetical protein
MGTTPLDWWFQPQKLRQEGDMDCGVCVFGELANLTRDQILRDLPEAVNGKTVGEWKAYLAEKGFEAVEYGPEEEHPLPCAHLVGIATGFHHWIYQAEDGGIHDPSPVFQHMPPKLIKLSEYNRVLTIAIPSRNADDGGP